MLTRGVRVVLLARSPAWCWPVPTWALPNAWGTVWGQPVPDWFGCELGWAMALVGAVRDWI